MPTELKVNPQGAELMNQLPDIYPDTGGRFPHYMFASSAKRSMSFK